MIDLIGVTKKFKTAKGHKVILDNVTVSLDAERGIGILGRNGAGKSTLVRLLSGTEIPDSGKIIRHSKLSWPLGLNGTFQPSMTGRDNVKFVARIYGVDVERVVEEVEEFAELGDYMDMPVGTYSNGMKARLAFGLSLAVNFDVYLIDEIIAVGDERFKQRSIERLKKRTETSKVIMISHQAGTIRDFCDKAAILNGGQLTVYPDLRTAFQTYKRIMSK